MNKAVNYFSLIILKIFNCISQTSCCGFYGEPDFPDELK
ncbi:MAG TPA: cyclic lactone autoinducer peptide [Clostridium sp.]|nr:cyclic lactone autoinducer peptide [Clostridium sp.]